MMTEDIVRQVPKVQYQLTKKILQAMFNTDLFVIFWANFSLFRSSL